MRKAIVLTAAAAAIVIVTVFTVQQYAKIDRSNTRNRFDADLRSITLAVAHYHRQLGVVPRDSASLRAYLDAQFGMYDCGQWWSIDDRIQWNTNTDPQPGGQAKEILRFGSMEVGRMYTIQCDQDGRIGCQAHPVAYMVW